MRTLSAGLGTTLLAIGMTAGAAEAQVGRGASYPVPQHGGAISQGVTWQGAPRHGAARPPGVVPNGIAAQRWQMRDGRWAGGWNAPGGWGGYRQPYAGWALPNYWVQPGFVISDWSTYGLAPPPRGYRWSRYYDDAVLIDARGSVQDSVSGLAWDGQGPAVHAAGFEQGGYDAGGTYAPDAYAYAYDERAVAPAPYEDRRGRRGRRSGLGGAAAGAVAGGIVGNVIGGRGNRLGGTLIGAGVGAAAGYAIDRASDPARDRGRDARYGAGYPAPVAGYAPGRPVQGYAPGYPPHGYVGAPGGWVSPDGRTTVTTAGGGGYYGGSTTTVVVQSAPVVTTTTTEYVDEYVTYRKPVARKVWRRPTKTVCRC